MTSQVIDGVRAAAQHGARVHHRSTPVNGIDLLPLAVGHMILDPAVDRFFPRPSPCACERIWPPPASPSG
jgi:hypothetical protein